MKVAVIEAGSAGRSWALVFARGGCEVTLQDPSREALDAAAAYIANRAKELQAAGLLPGQTPEQVSARLHITQSLEEAVKDADWIQEGGPEILAEKQRLFAAIDPVAPEGVIVASCTSGLPPSGFTENLKGRSRCLVAHCVNPPELLPFVEICPAPWTDPRHLEEARAFMAKIGMVPAVMTREVPGFLMNRLQTAVIAEAFRLVEDGIASVEDVDAAIKHALGLRWAFMGPFETIDLNAPKGLADWCERYGGTNVEIMQAQSPRDWSPELVAKAHAERRAILPMEDQPARQAWRDRTLMSLIAHLTQKS